MTAAIKVLLAAFSTDPDRLYRFEQEARAATAINHPNILAVYDIGTAERRPAGSARRGHTGCRGGLAANGRDGY